MVRFPLIGPSYTSQSPNADCQKTVNFYPEVMESQDSKSRVVLYPSPGLTVFSQIASSPSGPSGGLFSAPNGRLFACGNGTIPSIIFVEFFANAAQSIAAVLPTEQIGATPIQFAFSAQYCAFATPAGNLAFFDYTAPFPAAIQFALYSDSTQVTGISQVVFMNGYFLALKANSRQVIFSLDITTYDLTDFFTVSVTADNVLAMIVDHGQLCLYGSIDSVFYDNTGNPDNPFELNLSSFIQQGIAAPASLVQLDNTMFFIGGDTRGKGIAWRVNGYTPIRVSNHAVEYAWSQYSTIADAVAYAFQDQGHSFWQIYFPTANKTWVFDVSTQMWHERSHLMPDTGEEEAHRSWTHCMAFGKHLVGDWQTPHIYEMNIPEPDGSGGWSFVTDFGDPIKRTRRAACLSASQKRLLFSQMQVYLESGLGPVPPLTDGNGDPRAPQLINRWSNDSGHTWSNPYTLDCGQAGEYSARVIQRRLGQARNRVFEISCTDPVPWRFIDGFVEAEECSS